MAGQLNPSRPEDIHIFCPVRLYLGRSSFDGLLDTLDKHGGTFYFLTEDEPTKLGTDHRLTLQRERQGELVIESGENAFRIPSRVRGIRFDEDGLYMYVSLRFLLESEEEKRRLSCHIGMLW